MPTMAHITYLETLVLLISIPLKTLILSLRLYIYSAKLYKHLSKNICGFIVIIKSKSNNYHFVINF